MDTTNDTYVGKLNKYEEIRIIEVDTQVRRGYYAIRQMADYVFDLLGLLFLCPIFHSN